MKLIKYSGLTIIQKINVKSNYQRSHQLHGSRYEFHVMKMPLIKFDTTTTAYQQPAQPQPAH